MAKSCVWIQSEVRSPPCLRSQWNVLTVSLSWFSVTMGTGSVSLLLFELPYPSTWLYWLSVGTFLLNVLLFLVFLILTILRYTLYPFLFRTMLRDLGQSLFIGTLPMGFSTIVAMMIQLGVPILGQPMLTAGWALWWVDVTLSAASCITMPFLIASSQKTRELRFLTTAWLLPVVPLIVSSATGAVIAGILVEPHHALWTLMTCYALLGSGLSIALSILTVFSLRLMLHGFPARENSASMFLPLGPLGQGAFAIQKLGFVARGLLPNPDFQSYVFAKAGDVLYVIGWIASLPLVGLAILWLTTALIHLLMHRFPFNMVCN